MVNRHDDILEEMKSAGQTSPELGKELSRLSQVAGLRRKYQALDEEKESISELLREARAAKDKELERECSGELDEIARRRTELEARIIDAVLPQDEEDYESDTIIEIRAGTGGDEASLFASELLECYSKTAAALHWRAELLSESKTDIGGIREAALSITGSPSFRLPADTDESGPLLGPYGAFKFESGVHRVQRVPINDSRIHTSACSVAVLPSIAGDSRQEAIPPSELKIETMRSSGAGGQHVNTTDSAVRITHLPTGITASIQDERTQHKNKEKALKLITARVRDQQRQEAERSRGATRSSLMGGGDRSERIRTYNFPQDRISDHRSKETRHGIAVMLGGGAEDGIVVSFLPMLKALHREELLKQLEDNE